MFDPYPLVRPLVFALAPETAHRWSLAALARGWLPPPPAWDDPVLRTSLWGLDFPNPVGLAAGFDKNGEAPDALLDWGFGFVEVGSVTPRPQPGNPPPRLFRLAGDGAIVNRMGFNNDGQDAMAARLEKRRAKEKAGNRGGIIGVNLGKNKDTADAAVDYVRGIARLAPLADYVVVNVSSPNTPGLRALQGKVELALLLTAVQAALDESAQAAGGRRPPLLLKIAPDLTEEDKRDIAAVVLDLELDGLIATNTTITRPESVTDPQKTETGGLSGRPLRAMATQVLADMYRLTGGNVPLVGVGGIGTGADAYARIRAGASLVQVYSALIYSGPWLVNRIKRELADLLRRDGFDSVAEAVGADHELGG